MPNPKPNIRLHTLEKNPLKSVAFYNCQQASCTSQLDFQTTLLLQNASVRTYLKGAFS